MCDFHSISGAASCGTDVVKHSPIGALTGAVGNGVSSAASDVASSAFDKFVQTMVDSANWAIQHLMTLWLKVPSPDLGGGADAPYPWVQARTAYFVAAVVVAATMWSGIKLAIYGRSRDATDLVETLVRTIVTSILTATLVTAALSLTDSWSSWIITSSHLNISSEVLTVGSGETAIAPGVGLILAILLILTQLIQLMFMIMRNAIVILLAGTLTLSAAASGTRAGRQSFESSKNWLIAFIIYKPVAALIYAVAFRLASQKKDLTGVLSGFFLMILAVVALPALMRLVAPITATLGGANAASLAGATVGAAVATGAMAASFGASSAASGAAGGLGSHGAGGLLSGGGGPMMGSGGGPAGAVDGAAGDSGGGPSGGGGKGGSSGGGPGGAVPGASAAGPLGEAAESVPGGSGGGAIASGASGGGAVSAATTGSGGTPGGSGPGAPGGAVGGSAPAHLDGGSGGLDSGADVGGSAGGGPSGAGAAGESGGLVPAGSIGGSAPAGAARGASSGSAPRRIDYAALARQANPIRESLSASEVVGGVSGDPGPSGMPLNGGQQ